MLRDKSYNCVSMAYFTMVHRQKAIRWPSKRKEKSRDEKENKIRVTRNETLCFTIVLLK